MKYRIKPHPNSDEYDVLVFDTKVHHEMAIPKGLKENEIQQKIKEYLKGYDITLTDNGKEHIKGYENIYPETSVEEEEENELPNQ
jgi:ornithine carbamoyltransferase